MCFILVTHKTDCETRRISTLKVKHPEFNFDIYHPFEWPRACGHHVEGRRGDVCRYHGTCCEISSRHVCVFWVGYAQGIIKCRRFNREFHIIVPSDGGNAEVDIQFRDPVNDPDQEEDPVDNPNQLTEEEEQRLYEAQLDYINQGVRVRTVLEDSGNHWITDVNPPYDWRPTLNATANRQLLHDFDAARTRWESTCPMLKNGENALHLEAIKGTQSQVPYWYKAIKVPRPGEEGSPMVGSDGSSDDQPTPVQSSESDAGGEAATAADMVGGLSPVVGPVYGPGGIVYSESPDLPPPPSSDGPIQIWSRTPSEHNGPGLDGDDGQGPPAPPAAFGEHVPPAGPGYELLEPPAPVGWNGNHLVPGPHGEAEPLVQAPANPNLSSEQLSALRDMIVQQPQGNVPGVRVENGFVGIPVTGIMWLPAQGLLIPGMDAPFHLDNVDGLRHYREPDGGLRLPAQILGHLLNSVQREIPQLGIPLGDILQENVLQANILQENVLQANILQENVPQANILQENIPQENVPQANIPQENIPQANILQANIPQANIPQENILQANIRPEDVPVRSIENENGFGPPITSPLTDPEVPGGSGEGSRPPGSGESQRGGEGESTTNTNTNRRSSGNQGNDVPLPPTRSPSGGPAHDSIQPAAPGLVQGSPLLEPGNEPDGSRQSGPLPPANPPIHREEGSSEEGTTGLLSDMSNGALEELENALESAGSNVPSKTRKRPAEEDEVVVEEEPAPPGPRARRRQPAKRRRVEEPAEEPVDEPRYKLRQRRKVNYTK